MLASPFGIETLVKLLHEANAESPMLVTLALTGIDTLDKLVQDWNAAYPILVTLAGRLTLTKLLQEAKAYASMLVTPSGTMRSPICSCGHWMRITLFLSYKTPSKLL